MLKELIKRKKERRDNKKERQYKTRKNFKISKIFEILQLKKKTQDAKIKSNENLIKTIAQLKNAFDISFIEFVIELS